MILLAAANLSWISEAIAWILIGLIILFTLILSLKSNLLRDDIDDVATFAANATAQPQNAVQLAGATDPQTIVDKVDHPYSLSRVQLAVWTVVISCSYVYLALYRHQVIGLNATALELMGISIGTAGLANVIDQSQSNTATTTAPQPRHQNHPSEGFMKDILSDQDGVSIHRFQQVVWTAIAVVMYLYGVHSQDTLPTLSNTLIALAGISSAAYLGLKINENN